MVRKFDWHIDLTPRVKEILKGIAAGLKDEQLSRVLDVNINPIRMQLNLNGRETVAISLCQRG